MNYFQIITRVLQELKYPTVGTFVNLTNPEHLQIKNIINSVNKEVLLGAGYNVRETMETLIIPDTTENYIKVPNTINGEIKNNGIIVNDNIYIIEPNVSNFIIGNVAEDNYCIYGPYIYFGPKDETRTATILYLTYDFALDSDSVGKSEMSLETDTSIIPSDLIEQILVYGTCYYYKGSNSADARMGFWLQQYKNGIESLNGYNQSQEQAIRISIPTNLGIRGRIV